MHGESGIPCSSTVALDMRYVLHECDVTGAAKASFLTAQYNFIYFRFRVGMYSLRSSCVQIPGATFSR